MFAWVCLCFGKARYLQWAFPQGSSCHPLGTKLSPIPPNFTNRKQRETMKDAPHVIDMSPFCFPSKGLHYSHEGGRQNGSRLYHYWSVYHLSLVVFTLWDDLSPWRKRCSSLKLSTLPVRVLVMFLLYSLLAPVIFYFFREKCAR